MGYIRLIHFRKDAAMGAANVTLPAQEDNLASDEWIIQYEWTVIYIYRCSLQ